MKNYKIYLAIFVAMLGLSACSEAWLEYDPVGSTFTQGQYDQLDNSIEYHVSGLYTLLEARSGSDHSSFGIKTVDIVSDLISSDMAITSTGYGWFEEDASLTGYSSGSSRNSYFWSMYYTIIKNTNVLTKRLQDERKSDPEAFDKDATLLNYYAQTLTMRAYAYYKLFSLYSPSLEMAGDDLEKFKTTALVPYYNETSPGDSAVAASTIFDVANNVISDLTDAIAFYEKSGVERSSKQRFNKEIALVLRAKMNLELGNYGAAYEDAKNVVDSHLYSILPYDQVLWNGFNDITSSNWIWGKDVTLQTRGALASFWGHVCVHTYSYAYAGSVKAIDETLYAQIPETDIRRQWFYDKKSNAPAFKFFPVGKRDAYNVDEIDRDWLSDEVYLRIEEVYLIAAEAAARDNKLSDAYPFLNDLIDQRYAEDARQAKKDAVAAMSQTALLNEIYYQYRVELWGEGRSLQAMKRFDPDGRERGKNHFNQSSVKEVTPTQMVFQMPYAETTYNLNIYNNPALQYKSWLLWGK